MDIVERGRFCQSCQKTVTDFSQLSNDEILRSLSLSGNTCGRFAFGQLERVNVSLLPEPKQSSFSWKKFSIAAAFIGFVSFFKADAQIKPRLVAMPTLKTLNKSDTLAVRQIGVEKICTGVKKQSIDIAAIDVKSNDFRAEILGGIYIANPVNTQSNRVSTELIMELFQNYF